MALSAMGAMYAEAGRCLAKSVQSTKRREAELIASQAFSCLKVQKCVAAQLSQEDPRRLFRL